ncbi:hypothetical protein Tsp_10262 [Trichinella spiralis]|uniref:hypothetical protein n=1 Tax=Trichinella spiralis TaxID=6334 RepID=UPI0001EFDFC3|nr:hypothetical protein Tsp_10262 [Trichinella spiralis]
MLAAFSNFSNLFTQGNSPNQKPLSILEFLLTMKRTLRRAGSTRLLRICRKPFHLRMDQSDAGPAITAQLHRSAVDPKQADPTCYGNLALSVPLAQGYIDRLGEIWFQMISVSRHAPDSTHWLPHVDIKQPKAEYESVKALETYVVLLGCNALPYFSVPDSVKKLFNIEFGRRKDLTFQWKRALMNKVRQNELDTSSLEVRIAKHTAFIHHWSKLLSEMKILSYSVLTSIVGIKFHIQYFVCCCAKSISLPERDQPPLFSLDLPSQRSVK